MLEDGLILLWISLSLLKMRHNVGDDVMMEENFLDLGRSQVCTKIGKNEYDVQGYMILK